MGTTKKRAYESIVTVHPHTRPDVNYYVRTCPLAQDKACKPADPEHDPNIKTLEQRLEARIKKLELKLEEAKLKLDWYAKNTAGKKDEL